MFSPLVSPEELVHVRDRVRLLDVRSAAAYTEGHVEGALHADMDRDLSRAMAPDHDPARGGRHPLPPLKAWLGTLGRWGIGPGTPVVVYDDQRGANAARAWWMLRAVGHERVVVLDGGLQAAQEAGLALGTDLPVVEDLGPYPALHWQLTTVDIDVVESLARHADWKVLDVRATARYRGETEPLDPVAGHIPGARNLPFTENLGAGGRFKPKEELLAQYEAFLDGTPPERLVVHCGSGVTACHALLALEQAGLPGAALFVGSWSEWCRSGKPQAKGPE
ncbi:MAG TPA: sulfurtransferase [Holophagaceae bacterium]|nr:sulfurtransferase [Holophagaceae bacterium]